MGRRLLRLPLFYKILIANAGIVLVFSLLVIWMGVTLTDAETALTPLLILAGAGVLVSVAVNGVTLQVALEPLRLLKQTVDRVERGDTEARVPRSPLADVEMLHLMDATNAMLDRNAEYQRRLRDVAARALHAAEEERRRISLELHDDASQRLAAALMRLRLARGVDEPEAKDAVLDEVRSELAEAADELRRYAQGLRPPALDELGLAAAVESHVRMLNTAGSPIITVDTGVVGRLPSPEVELALYRIVQEALTNAVRHSGARRVSVRLNVIDEEIVAEVRDDGAGFDAHAMLREDGGARGLGLFGMRERAAYVGGTVDFETGPGAGTTVRARVPAAGAASPV